MKSNAMHPVTRMGIEFGFVWMMTVWIVSMRNNVMWTMDYFRLVMFMMSDDMNRQRKRKRQGNRYKHVGRNGFQDTR